MIFSYRTQLASFTTRTIGHLVQYRGDTHNGRLAAEPHANAPDLTTNIGLHVFFGRLAEKMYRPPVEKTSTSTGGGSGCGGFGDDVYDGELDDSFEDSRVQA